MIAKLKSTYRWASLTAFSGHEYTKKEWRRVPAGCEDQARAHEFLEVSEDESAPVSSEYRDLDPETMTPIVPEAPEKVVQDESKSRRRGRAAKEDE